LQPKNSADAGLAAPADSATAKTNKPIRMLAMAPPARTPQWLTVAYFHLPVNRLVIGAARLT
jgi:hypothetical protein